MGDYMLEGRDTIQRSASDSDDYDKWTSDQLAAYIAKNGLPEYKACILQHKITGKLAPLLTESNLQEMGINCIGDRLRFKLLVENLKLKARTQYRTRCIWEGKEQIFYSKISEALFTCFGCFPTDPSEYRLMSNYLKIKTVKPLRIGPVRLCCCNEYSVNNIDLSNVADVDVRGIPAPCIERICCCAPGKDVVDIEIRNVGSLLNHKIVLSEGQGDHVAGLVMNCVEESQILERKMMDRN